MKDNVFKNQLSILVSYQINENNFNATATRPPSALSQYKHMSNRCRCLAAPPLTRGGKYLTSGHSAWVRWNRTGDWFTLRRALSPLERNAREAGRREGESRELQQLSVRSVPADCR